MRDWLERNEPYIRLAYRVALLFLLVWIGRAVLRADPSYALSDIRDWLELISRQLKR